MASLPFDIDFTELESPSMACDYLVYVFGVDITDHIMGTISWTLADKDGFNVASFTVNNALDNFVVTLKNLGIDPASLDEKIDLGVSTTNVTEPDSTAKFRESNEDAMYNETPKKLIMEEKQSIDESGKIYPLGPRNIVFHKNDPVRIFLRYPYIHPGTTSDTDLWVQAFTGYINSASRTVNYLDGSSSISVSCTCIRGLMQKLRVGLPTAPSLKLTEVIQENPNTLFKDLIHPEGQESQPYAQKSFEEAMKSLVVGKFKDEGFPKPLNDENTDKRISSGAWKTVDQVRSENQSRDAKTRTLEGIGNMGMGFQLEYAVPTDDQISSGASDTDMMDDFYNLCLYGVYGTPVTLEEAKEIGKGTKPNGDFSPDNQYLHFLLPKVVDEGKEYNLKDARQLLKFEFITQAEQIDWTDRYNLIKQLIETIDYQFWVTGCGDIVFEMPMYDMELKQFGEKIRRLMIVDRHVIESSGADEGEDITTALICVGEVATSDRDSTTGVEQAVHNRVIVVAPDLASRVGLSIQSTPILTQRKESLKRLAEIEFNKRLAETNSLNFNFAWRPFLLPNKPVYHKTEERMGLTSSVSCNMPLFDTPDSNVSLRYIRRLTIENGEPIFSFLTGGKSVNRSAVKAWKSAEGTELGGTTVISTTDTKVSSIR